MSTWKTPRLKKLAKTLQSFENETDLLNFLRDLCTLEELDEMSRRWQVVQLLEVGFPYREITKKTGLSTTTVGRIAHWLNHGEGGYQAALRKS